MALNRAGLRRTKCITRLELLFCLMALGEWYRSLWFVRLGSEAAITKDTETRMKIKNHDLSRKDWEF